MFKQVHKLGLIAATAFGLAACDEQLGVDAGAQASLSFAATGGTTLLGDPLPPQNPVSVGGHVVAVNRHPGDLRRTAVRRDGHGQ
jgi:hypothetical protein